MPYLLDTTIPSELRKGRKADAQVRKWALDTAHERHFVSVVSIGEIRKGIELLRKRSPQQCGAFEDWLERLRTDYADALIPLDEAILEEWGRLMAAKTLPAVDGLIAATARHHQLIVATRNTADFAHAPVETVNPFGQV